MSEWLYEISGSRAVAENVASAMIHGIYGGDIDKLSARSVFDRFYWAYYLPNMGSDLRQMTMREQTFMSELSQDPQIRRMALKARGALLHFGRAGMDSLPKALADVLEATPNVEIKKGIPVRDISYDMETEKVNVSFCLPTGQRIRQHLGSDLLTDYNRQLGRRRAAAPREQNHHLPRSRHIHHGKPGPLPRHGLEAAQPRGNAICLHHDC